MKTLFALPRRIREVKSDAELTEIENQVDAALDAEMANAIMSENAQDIVHVGLAGASAGGFDPSPPADDRGEAPGGEG